MALASLSESSPPDWGLDDEDTLVCRRIVAETHDVKTFTFAARTPHLFRFEPGQFLTFDFEIEGATVNRCYTIASAPTRPHLLSITVKRVPGGVVSPWLHATMAPGVQVRATAPLGIFSAAQHPAAKYLLLSAGSGITPLMSMSRSFADIDSAADVMFLHSARSPADIIFRDELALIARQSPTFRHAVICETDAPTEAWAGYRGRLTLPMLQLAVPDLAEREIFTCGPAPYMASVREILAATGFDQAHYHEESFVFEDLPTEEAPPLDDSGVASSFKIQFAKSGRTIDCDAETPILTAARKAGMRLPSSCTQGMCGTCKSKLLEGRVDMRHQGGIRQREIDQGQILICCSKPLSDLVIDR